MSNFERLQEPEEVSRRRNIVSVGVNYLVNAEIVAFGAYQEDTQPNETISPAVSEAITPEAQLAKVYNLDDQRQTEVETPPVVVPEVVVHQNQAEIDQRLAAIENIHREAA